MDSRLERIDKAIRKKADFPRKGILYNDISGLTVTPDAFGDCIDLMYEYAKERDIDRIAGIDARGFVLGAPLAYRMHLPLTWSEAGQALWYGAPEDVSIGVWDGYDLRPGRGCPERGPFLVCDDLIATGGTVLAPASCSKSWERRWRDASPSSGCPIFPTRKC
jgi:adenine phosphoribosyltransferase